MTIDKTSYNKAKRYPPRHGYQLRGTQPSSIVVHSTSNRIRGTSFAAEAKFLFDSPEVSAHYLISKTGVIVEFLEPAPWQAWHAGECREPWANSKSLGIELHHSVGDPPYPQAQKAALAWLLKDLSVAFGIPPARIETHGQVALPGPYDRKRDPADWSHLDFIAWRNALFAPPPTNPLTTHTLPAPNNQTRACGAGFHRFYHECGGLNRMGYALTDEIDDGDCTWMRLERAVLRYSPSFGLEFALISEAQSRGWI